MYRVEVETNNGSYIDTKTNLDEIRDFANKTIDRLRQMRYTRSATVKIWQNECRSNEIFALSSEHLANPDRVIEVKW